MNELKKNRSYYTTFCCPITQSAECIQIMGNEIREVLNKMFMFFYIFPFLSK